MAYWNGYRLNYRQSVDLFGSILLLVVSALVMGCGDAQRQADGSASKSSSPSKQVELLNVSYDPTRELWKALNSKFVEEYQKKTGIAVTINQSHAASASQARTVIDGLPADVVTLAMPTDTEAVSRAGLIKAGWQEEFPNGSLPYYSTLVFVIRKGNPKNIKDWPDLVKGEVAIITPSPKTSGNGKLSFLAAWGSVVTRGGSEVDAKKFVTELYKRVPVLDSGARGSTATFSQKGIGDVHLTWENEAFLEKSESKGELEIIIPPVSIRAEPRVAIVDVNVDRKGTRAVAEDYLNFAYTDEGQQIIADNYYRPSNREILEKNSDKFSNINLFVIDRIANDWADAEQRFFADGAVFDSIFSAGRK